MARRINIFYSTNNPNRDEAIKLIRETDFIEPVGLIFYAEISDNDISFYSKPITENTKEDVINYIYNEKTEFSEISFNIDYILETAIKNKNKDVINDLLKYQSYPKELIEKAEEVING